MSALQSFGGIVFFVGVVFLISRSRKNVSLKFVSLAILAQFVIAFVLLKIPAVSEVFLVLNRAVIAIQNATNKASAFMFGYVAGGPTPFEIVHPNHSFIVAFQVLPLILVVGALSALLFHFGILTWVVSLFSRVLRKMFPISGPLGFGASACVFLGTIEAPLLIRPYLSRLSNAELLSLIVCSMSTVSGTVIVLYASVLESVLPNSLTHLITASLISVPASLMLAHVFMPFSKNELDEYTPTQSKLTWIEVLLDSIKDGLEMVLSIVAIIIVLFSFVYLSDAAIGMLNPSWSIGYLVGELLRPIMWLVGFDWQLSHSAAQLMGSKIVLNEFVSYYQLSQMDGFSNRSLIVLVYSLCGFANIGSAGIIIAGLTSLIPNRRTEVVSYTFWSLLLGNLVTLITGSIVNIVLSV